MHNAHCSMPMRQHKIYRHDKKMKAVAVDAPWGTDAFDHEPAHGAQTVVPLSDARRQHDLPAFKRT